ncbi:MAG TPA: polysaccharide ABC transporter ATP-binding protein [Cyclobacteriaceae bacterium]|nr:polysaccharide ABC transporter ATP-binding protein [Cyclobacteriaceae bacterium]
MSAVIKVENLGKQYRLGTIGTGTLAHDLNRWWHTVRGKEDPYMRISEVNDRERKGGSEYVWALRDISFEVQQGDVLGIIGRNGAGKSTLLKILSRTTAPTSGSVKARGRIASLLEVGTGFHPELTGRENIILNGAILGMKKKEIMSRFDEIVDFSGVERYIDTPVKRYSSGMYVRLAFAVAAHLEPEILIVDEVLAVGDAEFQKKCLGKMKDVSGQGRTVLFVSHNMGAIRQLCKTGLLINKGLVEASGSADEVIHQYFRHGYEGSGRPPVSEFRVGYNMNEAPVFVEDIFIEGHKDISPTLGIGEEPRIVLRLNSRRKISGANVTLTISNSEGVNLGMAFSWDDEFYLDAEQGIYNVVVQIKGLKITPGQYFVGVGLNQSTQTLSWDGISYYPLFSVQNRDNVTHFPQRSWGINHLAGNSWTISKE